MVIAVLYPRFELLAALGDRRALLSEPLALAPEAGREQVLGEVSAPAEAFGVARGMRLGEALARCTELQLVPPDPEGVRSLWNVALDRVEELGASVESDYAGIAYFESRGLHGIHGGSLDGVLTAVRRALGGGARIGASSSRFAAYAAATHARPRARRGTDAAAVEAARGAAHRGALNGAGGRSGVARRAVGDGLASPRVTPAGAVVVEPVQVQEFLAPLPVSLLHTRHELEALPEVLQQLGIRTLGEVASLPARSMAERFGHPGLLALDLARGRDTTLEPRRPAEPVSERLDLPEAASGQQLERALELLVGRVLARRERRGRALRGLAVSARFVAGGTWRTTITLRHASADPARIRLALGPRLADLPAPAESLALEVEAFGPPAHDQAPLLEEQGAIRRARLGEAVRQARHAAGRDAAMRVLEVDPDSRVPERRAMLAPFPETA